MNAPDRSDVPQQPDSASRRAFLKRSAATVASGSLAAGLSFPRDVHAAGDDTIRIGLVGCGGRGCGAAVQALSADGNTKLVAMADAFDDRLDRGIQSIQRKKDVASRVAVDADHRFTGFDGYKQVIASDVDVVLLATPPQFRPIHLQACIDAGKHVFAEKPVAVDAPGVHKVLAAAEQARKKDLCIVSGLNGRYSFKLQDLVKRIHDGAIGDIMAVHAGRYGGGVWVRPREPGMTEMQYQMRNWYYFTWLSGDFNVEQFVHQLDRIAWVLDGEYPADCYSTGGRQARTGPEYGHIYDHFASVFEYDSGARAYTTTRHQRGCPSVSRAYVLGTKGVADLSDGVITGENPWRAGREDETDSHQLEQNAFFAALRDGRVINNGEYMAKSTMMAILSRMSAYTGDPLTWEKGMNSQQDLSPSNYDWDGAPPKAEVAVPGLTKFV